MATFEGISKYKNNERVQSAVEASRVVASCRVGIVAITVVVVVVVVVGGGADAASAIDDTLRLTGDLFASQIIRFIHRIHVFLFIRFVLYLVGTSEKREEKHGDIDPICFPPGFLFPSVKFVIVSACSSQQNARSSRSFSKIYSNGSHNTFGHFGVIFTR